MPQNNPSEPSPADKVGFAIGGYVLKLFFGITVLALVGGIRTFLSLTLDVKQDVLIAFIMLIFASFMLSRVLSDSSKNWSLSFKLRGIFEKQFFVFAFLLATGTLGAAILFLATSTDLDIAILTIGVPMFVLVVFIPAAKWITLQIRTRLSH